MRSLTIGAVVVAAVFAAVVLLPTTQAEAVGVRVSVGGFYPGYYGPSPYAVGYPGYYGRSPYAVGYRGYYAPPVRAYAYRPPVVYAPAPVYVAPPVYVPAPVPPCAHYHVWER